MSHPSPVADSVTSATVCVVGGGPAGVFAALLFARRGVDVVMLESHKDFDRDFRGDTVHASTLEILDQIGLADQVLAIPHGRIVHFRMITPQGEIVLADFSRLKSKFPYIATVPQAKMLALLADQARKYSDFRCEMGATVNSLIEHEGTVAGVRYATTDGRTHDVLARLTIGADGRFSKMRSLAGFVPAKTSPPMDVVWFRLPKAAADPNAEGAVHIARGHLAVLIDRGDGPWQVGLVILKGSFSEVKKAGIGPFRDMVGTLIPWLADRTGTLADWGDVNVLAVESSLLPCWHKPGLLLIGDAAHVMSPVGGVGINYAVQDAVEAVNILTPSLIAGTLTEADLARVQQVRTGPVKRIQSVQRLLQERIIRKGMSASGDFRPSWMFRVIQNIPGLRNLPARMIAYGTRKVRVES